MSSLSLTEQALANIAGNEQFVFGFHDGEDIRTGVIGRDIAETDFDPAIHDPSDIDPLSIWEDITGAQQVQQTIPDRPLSLNLITHVRQQQAADYFDIQGSKRHLAGELRQALTRSLPGMTDMIMDYEVGDVSNLETASHAEVIDTQGDSVKEAKLIAEICQNGLSIVISDFLNLPLTERSSERFPATVAIKANHPFDLSLPADCGKIPLGKNGGEVNTGNRRELQSVNNDMRISHEQTIARLQKAGIAVAQIIFNRRDFPILGFDLDAADMQIASALAQISTSEK